MRGANFEILSQTAERVLIRDVGPWNLFSTVTNDAENVVASLAAMLRGRRLEYEDSEGDRWELLVADGRFAGFA